MTDIEQRARDMVLKEDGGYLNYDAAFAVLCRAIEQHEAFKQEVSDAVEAVLDRYYVLNIEDMLSHLIISKPKPDPLVEAFDAVWPGIDRTMVNAIRAALEARGLEIRSKNDD